MLIGRRLNDYQSAKVVPFGHWDAYTRGNFVIMPHVQSPLSLALCCKEHQLSFRCKKCGCSIHPTEVKVPGNYSHYKCPVCGVSVSLGRSKGVLALLGIAFLVWAFSFSLYHLTH